MGWLITLGILTLLAVLPLGVSASYDEQGLLIRLIIGPLKFTLIPAKKKDKKPEKKTPAGDDKQTAASAEEKPVSQENQTPTQTSQPAGNKKTGGSLRDFEPLIKLLLELLDTFRRKLRVNYLRMKLIMAADDPCDLAVNYGRAWAAVGNLLPQLERVFVIKKRDIDVQCDFTASESRIIARLDLTITLGRILAIAVVYGIRALMEYLKINKKRKGGASR